MVYQTMMQVASCGMVHVRQSHKHVEALAIGGQSIDHGWIIKSAKFIWNDNHFRLSHSNHITNFAITINWNQWIGNGTNSVAA